MDNFIDKAKSEASELVEKGKDLAGDLAEKGKDALGHIVEEGKEAVEKVKDMFDGDDEKKEEAPAEGEKTSW